MAPSLRVGQGPTRSRPIRGEGDDAESGSGTAMSGSRQRPRVLLVDDYPDAREMYREYLRLSGFDVVEATNGVEALQRASDAGPDIILMDLALPVMDGWEATRRLKSDARTAGIPVVALTGHVMPRLSEDARSAGCDACVTKPCLPEDLVREIRRVLGDAAAKVVHRTGRQVAGLR